MQNQTNFRRSERAQRFVFVAWFISLLVLVCMFLGTHVPPFGPHTISQQDKLFHAGAYLLLTVCLLGSWELTTGILQPAHYFAVWLFGTLYGLFDEITQIPFGRCCDGLDWLADIFGIVLGLMLFQIARLLIYRITGPGSSPAFSANAP